MLTTIVISSVLAAAQEFVSLAGAEVYRGNAEKEKRIYPGGPFDPLGFAKVPCPQAVRPASGLIAMTDAACRRLCQDAMGCAQIKHHRCCCGNRVCETVKVVVAMYRHPQLVRAAG